MATTKTTKKTASESFTAEERAAMKAHATELRARGRAQDKAASDAQAVKEAIAAMPPADRKLATAIDQLVTKAAPGLAPKTWYGMPAYANEAGKVVCFFKAASKFKVRYATFGFEEGAQLDDGGMWVTSFALTELSDADERKLAKLVEKAAG
ncbi:MAG: hypothetical protein QOC55_2825 [Thermoleophilaceae bacterium]|jgi:uncharacterized protein YdhG (YjbR/CyaY superfamily)|nr:hypothetical protein [Thermoleophilaceae bacterium]